MDDKDKDNADTAMDQLPPLVIVLSKGKETTDNIINSKQIISKNWVKTFHIFFFFIFSDIRKIPITDNIQPLNECDLTAYKYHITTKYYETDILFVPYDKSLNTFPIHLRIFVEGLFVYFDANDVSIPIIILYICMYSKNLRMLLL